MMRSWLLLLGLALSFAMTTAYASHISGVNIEYQCLGNNQYLITLNLFRDCDGITMSATEDIEIESICGPSQTVTLNQGIPPGGTGVGGLEISQLCAPDLPLSTCNGGNLPGMQHYVYTGIVTIAPPCDPWRISWSTCCRNNSVNVPSSNVDDIYAEAMMYSATDTCNNSPIFTAQPIPYVCVNQPVVYNYGVYDPDGDSLVYSFIPGRESPTGILGYAGGYSGVAPIPGITINNQTGEITFTPTMTGNFIVVVQVQEYDANGNLVGTVMRDMQFTVIACTNIVPDPPAAMTAFGGTAVQTGPFNMVMCTGNDFTLDLVFTDQNANDTLTLTSNVTTVLPGATFAQTGVNPATATITWVAVPGTGNLVSFTVQAEDDACPVTGLTQQTVAIQIAPSVNAGPDVLNCGPFPTPLSTGGGSVFQWTVLSGDPIVVGTNFSCDTCPDPIATPAYTTTYIVSSNLTGNCINEDTVMIQVVPDFGFNFIDIKDVTCNGGNDAHIAAEPFGSAGPPWTWELYDSSMSIVQSSTSNGSDTLPGLPMGTYTLRLIEPLGCFHDTLLTVNEPAAMTITATDSVICLTTNAVISAQASGGNGTNYTYTWNQGLVGNGPHVVGPMVTTEYVVFATDNMGCTSPNDTATVTLYPGLTLTPTGPDSICIDDAGMLMAAGMGGDGGPYTYQWEEVGAGLIGSGNSISVTPLTSPISYAVVMTDGCGSPAATDTLEVAWYPAPRPLILADKYEDCFPAAIQFTNATDPSDVGGTCIWDFGDGAVVGGGCTTINHTYANVGCYDVSLTVYSPEGCIGDTTLFDLICARPYPIAEFSFGPQPTNIFNTNIYFLNGSVNGVSYEWLFGENGDLGSTTAQNPYWPFPENGPGEYPVWLYTTNIYGCVDSVQHTVVIDAEYLFWVPNAFTPDGDGLNDFFGVSGEGISTEGFELKIFNRWGEEIYSTNDPYKPWDGQDAIQGVYPWRIEAVNEYSRIKREYLGHVTLLR